MTELEKKYQNFEIYFKQFPIDQLLKWLNQGIQSSNESLENSDYLKAILKVLQSRNVDCKQFEKFYQQNQGAYTSLQVVLVPTV